MCEKHMFLLCHNIEVGPIKQQFTEQLQRLSLRDVILAACVQWALMWALVGLSGLWGRAVWALVWALKVVGLSPVKQNVE